MKRLLVFLVFLTLAFFISPASVYAQEPTPEPTFTPIPTPTSTPSYLVGVPLSTGSELVIRKEVTFGEIAVVIAVLVLAAIELMANMIKVPRMWFR